MNFADYLNMKALIIDDETDICYLLSKLLRQKNMETSFVNSLSEAGIALREDRPEIIFLDNHLPDGLGMNYIPYIKEYYPGIKVVMITADDSADDREKAFKNGADYFIGKPFNREIIFKAVETVAE